MQGPGRCDSVLQRALAPAVARETAASCDCHIPCCPVVLGSCVLLVASVFCVCLVVVVLLSLLVVADSSARPGRVQGARALRRNAYGLRSSGAADRASRPHGPCAHERGLSRTRGPIAHTSVCLHAPAINPRRSKARTRTDTRCFCLLLLFLLVAAVSCCFPRCCLLPPSSPVLCVFLLVLCSPLLSLCVSAFCVFLFVLCVRGLLKEWTMALAQPTPARAPP